MVCESTLKSVSPVSKMIGRSGCSLRIWKASSRPLISGMPTLGRVAVIKERCDARPLYVNTWGDAICAVFENVETAGLFALALQNILLETDWETTDLKRDISIRIGLHAGPVYKCFDPLLGHDTYNGAHVNRAARIEPVAEEGQIFASDAFAALAAIAKPDEFLCDYAGTRKLPKGAGMISTFLVRPTH